MHTEDNLITLSPAERKAILQHVPLPKGVDARLRFAVQGNAGVELHLSDQDFYAFVQSMLRTLAETEDMGVADVLTGIISRFQAVLSADVPETFDRALFPEDMPDEICQEIHSLLQTGQYDTLDAAFEAVQALLEEHNNRVHESLMGLTPAQGYRLLASGWNGPDSVIQILDGPAAEDLAESAYYQRALALLRLLDEAGGAELTAKKNLKRTWVQRLLKAFSGPDLKYYLDDVEFAKLVEDRCMPVHMVRVLLELAKLVRVRQGKLILTRLGQSCLKPDRAGELQARLFLAMVTELNLAYMDRAPECPELQETYPYVLYVLGQVGREPINAQEARALAFLPDVAESFEGYPGRALEDLVFYSRVIRPLRDFGLLRTLRDSEEEEGWDIKETRIQLTPLFDQMIYFDLHPCPENN